MATESQTGEQSRAEQASGNGPQKPASERRPLRSNPLSPLPPHQHLAYRSPLSFFLTLMLQYTLETTVFPREPECTKELRQITAKHPWCVYVPALRPTSGIKSVIEDRNRSLMICQAFRFALGSRKPGL